MIPFNLYIFLITTYILLFIFLTTLIIKKKISFRDSVYWYIFIILMFFLTIFNNVLTKMASFLGFKLISNMIFFMGFLFLIVILINISKNLSKEKEKVVILCQELAILKKEIKEKSDD